MTVELLAPAGDIDKLKTAIDFGADAVYLGGESFGLRTASKNFTIDDIKQGVIYAHDRGKKVYVTLNIIPHDEDLIGLENYLIELENAGIDAVIVADPGTFSIVKKTVPNMEIHISTQASITNFETIMFWYNQGVRRVVLARELSLDEIINIKSRLPEDMELEAFVHGAMCISYSGRCLLSNYMTGRDANLGDCAHACRYKYSLVEEKRPGEYFDIVEDEKGTFILNSKDLSMIEHIDKLIEAGINSLKIEGRVKSAYYVATVVRAYRHVIDSYLEKSDNYKFDEKWLSEIKKASHRDFTTGFYFGDQGADSQVYDSSSYIRNYDFVGVVRDFNEDTMIATIEQRNRVFKGDKLELFGPKSDFMEVSLDIMWDEDDNEIDVAPHAQQLYKIKLNEPVELGSMLRKKID